MGNAAVGAGLGLVDDLNYSETLGRGFLLMTITKSAIKGEYIFVSTVKSSAYSVSIGKTVTVSSSGAVSYL